MIEIDSKIISDDILEEQIVCDLSQCKGACCVEGDAGAPLEKEEIKEIENDFIIDDEDMQEEWVACKSDDEICAEMNLYNKKFDSFEPSNNFEKLIYNSILNIDKQFNL